MTTTGGCLCGAIRYHLDDAPSLMGVCHCRNCQRQAGSAFSTLAGAPAGSLHFDAGEPACYEDRDTDSGNLVRRYFCGTCGSPIYSAVPGAVPRVLNIRLGTARQRDQLVPKTQIWARSKLPWLDDLPGFRKVEKQ